MNKVLRAYRKKRLEKEGIVGREWGGKVPVCIVYPNTYYTGMSNLGFQCVHHLFSGEMGIVAERAFLPDRIEEILLTGAKRKLFSLESQRSLSDFYMIAFSISYENDYLNILRLLNLAGIPRKRKDRGNSFPLLIAGGISPTLNPEPLAEIMDAIFIGDGDEAVPEIAKGLRLCYEKGKSKEYLLKYLVEIEGIYIPSFYEVERGHDGIAIGLNPVNGAPARVTRRITRDIDAFIPQTFIHTSDTEFSNMKLIEIGRGCTRKCRFCAAGFAYLPPRFRSLDRLKKTVMGADNRIKKIGLLSTLPTEHPEIQGIVDFITKNKLKFSLSSVRMGSLTGALADSLMEGFENTVTLAPETGSERLRFAINKGITNSEITAQIEIIRQKGISNIRLYFMFGLPTETDEDVCTIANMLSDLSKSFSKTTFHSSLTPFVPKAQTPFQWASFERAGILRNRKNLLLNELRGIKNVTISFNSSKASLLEAIFSMGGRTLSAHFAHASPSDLTYSFFKDSEMKEHIHSERSEMDMFPWDIVDSGIKKDFLYNEYKKTFRGGLTALCKPSVCRLCGLCY